MRAGRQAPEDLKGSSITSSQKHHGPKKARHSSLLRIPLPTSVKRAAARPIQTHDRENNARSNKTRTVLRTSAPENPSVRRASNWRSTSPPQGTLARDSRRISRRDAVSGGGTYTSRSSRPGRSRAGSITSGRLVAATTTKRLTGWMPSSSVSS